MKSVARILPAALVLVTAATAHAAGGGHHEGIPWLTLLFSTINVIIFIFVMRRFALPVVQEFVKERHARILGDLSAADDARTDALRIKAEWEQRLAHLEESIAGMREQAKQDAQRERDRILADARKTAERIQRDAEQSAAAELRQLRATLRVELTRQAMQLAEKNVRERWTDADQQRFVADFLEQVQA